MKILLVQTSFLGDNILSTPVINGITSAYPDCTLAVLTTVAAAPVYEGNPAIEKVLIFDKRGKHSGLIGLFRCAGQLRREKFDIVYSLHRSARTAVVLFLSRIPIRIGFSQATLPFLYTRLKHRPKEIHEVERNLALLLPEYERSNEEAQLSLPVQESATAVFQEFSLERPDSYAVLVPGSVWATKRWAATEFRKTAQRIRESGRSVLLLGAPTETAIAEEVAKDVDLINLAGKTTLKQMFALIREASLVVCNDSMSLHVASTFKVPTVVVFCATSPTFGFGPWENNRARVVEKENLHCKPCQRHGGMVCPEGTNACMVGVPALDVCKAIAEVTGWQL